MAEDFKAYREQQKQYKQGMYQKRLAFLKRSGWNFKEFANGHVRVFTKFVNFDAWLSTGSWTVVGSGVQRKGWNDLVDIVRRTIDIDNLTEEEAKWMLLEGKDLMKVQRFG